ncbi:DUF4974 domain-containing protein [Flavobacteriaceae bacterium GF1]
MSTQKAYYLIVKFLSDKLNEEERKQLETLLEDPENENLFSELVHANFASEFSLKEFSSTGLQKVLREKIRREKRPSQVKRIGPILKYAAVLVLILGIGYFFSEYLFVTNQGNGKIVPKDDAIILEREDGKTQILNPLVSKAVENDQGIVVGQQEKNVIRYTNNSDVETLVYNTLRVPYGKRFDLVLSDGTKVFLNAGTSLKYPVKFLPGKKREVFLSGEAFFDVEKDQEHPFIVNAHEMDIEVLGTKFVVSLYEEDASTSVVLVEGAVDLSIENTGKNTLLTPGTMGVLDSGTTEIITKTVDTNFYTSWMDGVLIFRGQTFGAIAKKLERIYNVSIDNENTDFNNEVFNASFNNESIENILIYFKDSYEMEYTIENGKVIIK